MQGIERLTHSLDSISIAVGRAAAWCSVPIIFIVILDVVTRRFFTLGSVTLQELEWHFHAILFLGCAGWAYLTDSHVRVDVFRARVSERKQVWIEFLGGILFLLPFCVVMIYLGSKFTLDSFYMNEVSDAPGGLPYRYIIKSAFPLGFVILLLQGISQVLKSYLFLFRGPTKGGA